MGQGKETRLSLSHQTQFREPLNQENRPQLLRPSALLKTFHTDQTQGLAIIETQERDQDHQLEAVLVNPYQDLFATLSVPDTAREVFEQTVGFFNEAMKEPIPRMGWALKSGSPDTLYHHKLVDEWIKRFGTDVDIPENIHWTFATAYGQAVYSCSWGQNVVAKIGSKLPSRPIQQARAYQIQELAGINNKILLSSSPRLVQDWETNLSLRLNNQSPLDNIARQVKAEYLYQSPTPAFVLLDVSKTPFDDCQTIGDLKEAVETFGKPVCDSSGRDITKGLLRNLTALDNADTNNRFVIMSSMTSAFGIRATINRILNVQRTSEG